MPSRILYITDKTVAKLYSFFSIDLLLKTLFLPWKRDEIDTSNMALDDKLRVLLMNLVSRLVGAVVRLGTVIIGISAIAGAGILGFVSLLVFILSPILAAILIVAGIFI